MAKLAMESSIPCQYLLVLVALAVERGCAPAELFHNTSLNLNVLSSPGSRIDEAEADQIISNALAATGDPSLLYEDAHVRVDLVDYCLLASGGYACISRGCDHDVDGYQLWY